MSCREPIFVSFATTDYEAHLGRLCASLAQFNLANSISAIGEDMPWHKAQALKPTHVWAALMRFPGHPIVWIDADAIIRKRPTLFFELGGDDSFDICAHFYRAGRELLSGTVYFRNTLRVRNLVEMWAARCTASPSVWDQQQLQRLVEQQEVIVKPLPPSYVQIHDTMKDIGEPVIEHFQESRRKKRTNP